MLYQLIVLLTMLIYNLANYIEEITELDVGKQQDTEPDANQKYVTEEGCYASRDKVVAEVIQNTNR